MTIELGHSENKPLEAIKFHGRFCVIFGMEGGVCSGNSKECQVIFAKTTEQYLACINLSKILIQDDVVHIGNVTKSESFSFFSSRKFHSKNSEYIPITLATPFYELCASKDDEHQFPMQIMDYMFIDLPFDIKSSET